MDPDPQDPEPPRLGPNKKCTKCCKWLTAEQMGQHVVKGKLTTYSMCLGCRTTRNTSVRLQRNPDSDKKRKEREEDRAALGPAKTCICCHAYMPLEQFDLKSSSSSSAPEDRFAVCNKCRARNRINGSSYRSLQKQRMEFECVFDDCGKRFAIKQQLAIHERIHSGERPFQCRIDECDKAFSHKQTRDTHEKTHGIERPYQCSFEDCGRCFRRKDELGDHEKRHKAERSYFCRFDGCGRAFFQCSDRKLHERREHTGERPHVCQDDNCGAAFVTSGELKKHFDRMHSKEAAKHRKLQEKAMSTALVLGGYVESFTNGLVPAPGEFTREVYFDHRCALARNFMPGEKKYAFVDFVVHTKRGRLVFLEIDEGQHPSPGYSQLCETTRMWNICESIKLADLEMNVFWLRVNPDSTFKLDGSNHARERKQRFQEVLEFLDAIESRETDPPMQIGYAFYNCSADHRPLVMNDPEYVDDVKPAVVCIQNGSKLVQPREFPPLDPMFQSIDMNFAQSDSDSD